MGSFIMINMIKIARTTSVTERFEEDTCKQQCFAMTTNYEQKIAELKEKEKLYL
jgi:hypothetical protein